MDTSTRSASRGLTRLQGRAGRKEQETRNCQLAASLSTVPPESPSQGSASTLLGAAKSTQGNTSTRSCPYSVSSRRQLPRLGHTRLPVRVSNGQLAILIRRQHCKDDVLNGIGTILNLRFYSITKHTYIVYAWFRKNKHPFDVASSLALTIPVCVSPSPRVHLRFVLSHYLLLILSLHSSLPFGSKPTSFLISQHLSTAP